MHAMLEIRLMGSSRLCLVPLVPDIVPSVDLENRIIRLNPPSGLLDLSYEERQKIKVIKGFLPNEVNISKELRKELEGVSIVVSFQSSGTLKEYQGNKDMKDNHLVVASRDGKNNSYILDDDNDDDDNNDFAPTDRDEYELEQQEREIDRKRQYY